MTDQELSQAAADAARDIKSALEALGHSNLECFALTKGNTIGVGIEVGPDCRKAIAGTPASMKNVAGNAAIFHAWLTERN